jgi:protein TonB
MTIVYTERVDSEDRTQLLQWGISLLLIALIHFGVGWWVLVRVPPQPAKPPPPPAAYLDLPPLSNGPLPPNPVPAPTGVTPPAPKLPSAPEPTPKPPAPPKAEAPPPPPPPPKSVAPAIIPPQAAPAVVPKVAPPRPPAPKPAPQQHTQPKAAATPAPPAQGSNTPLYVDPMREWQIAAAQRLEKFKKVSQAASWQGEEGVVGLQITIDKKGHILSAFVSSSSGYSTLDLQAMTMCRLAKHLPPLPASFKESTYSFPVSITFYRY